MQKLDAPGLELRDGCDDVVGAEGNVLDSGTMVIIYESKGSISMRLDLVTSEMETEMA